MVSQVPVTGPGGTEVSAITWPVRSGTVPPLVEGFTPRLESAQGLGVVLIPGSTVAITPATATQAAPGLPDWRASCGKTQLAAHAAETMWLAREIDLLAWITATSRGSVVAGLAAAAVAAVGIDPAGEAEMLAGRFIDWLTQTSRPWLVVLDGLADPQDLGGLWPAGPCGRTLITTADAAVRPGWEDVVSFPVAGFSRREALGYLHSRLTQDRGQRTGAIDLVDQLGGEPLALAQASAVIEGSALSCRDYLEHVARKRAQLGLPRQEGWPSAAVTWTLCVEQAYRLLPGGAVQPLLTLAAMLDGTAIPVTVLTSAAAREYSGGAGRGLATQDDAWHGVLSLERAGLLTIDQGTTPPTVRISAAVQAAIRSATPDDMVGQTCVAAANALLEVWPADDLPSWLGISLRSSATAVIERAGNALWTDSSYRLLYRMGQSLESARLTGLAAVHWNEVAAASEQVLGLGHPDALAASDHLAAAFLVTGRAGEALPWFRSVLADRNSLLGPEHAGTIGAAIGLGRALIANGRADEAITVLDQAVIDSKSLFGADHRDTLGARDALADACCAAGKLPQGIRLYQRTLSDQERVLGKLDPATMTTALKLGDAYIAAERFKDALAVYKKILADRERTLGRDHSDTIVARTKLAAGHHTAGRIASALRLYEEARADSEHVRGSDHPATLALLVSLAHAYYSAGRISDAVTLLRDTAERCDRVLPPGDPLTRTARESLENIAGV